MSTARSSCLVVLSSAVEGVLAQSFVQAFTLLSPNFNIQLASPGGRLVEYVEQDDSNRRWFAEFRSKATSAVISLESVDVNRYSALLIPPAPGAVHDLATSPDLSQILSHFVSEKKPICAIGDGVAGLCSAMRDGSKSWILEDYVLTAPSVYELARNPEFSSLPIIIEDVIKDNGAKYSCSGADCVHIVVDRHLITGQNPYSTVIAVQNLILMGNQKQGKSTRSA